MTSVELHLPPGQALDDLPALVTLRRGQPLSRRAVRESIARLWETHRFADIVVRQVPDRGGVKVVFDISAKRCFEEIGVVVTVEPGRDRPALTDEQVVQASGLAVRPPGSERCPDAAEYYPARLRQAVEGVKEAYARRGFDSAEVVLELFEQTGGMLVDFKVKEGPRTRIGAVTVAGFPGFELNRVLDEADIAIGGEFDRDALDDGLAKLKEAYRRERHYRAQLGEPQVTRQEGVAAIALPIDAGPRFDLRFRGNRSFASELLRGVLNYQGGETLDGTLVARLERRLLAFYRYRGFPDATVTSTETVSPRGDRAVLAFEIEEGWPLHVDQFVFSGNQARGFGSAALREVAVAHVRARAPELSADVRMTDDPLELEGRVDAPVFGAPLLQPQNVYIEEAFREAAAAMTQQYRDRGYRSAAVRVSTERSVVSHHAKVRFEISEGPRTVVRQVSFGGVPSELNAAQEAQRAGIEVGAPFSDGRIEAARQRLTDVLATWGYLFAAVKATASLTEDGRGGILHYEVLTGPQVRVGQILPRGLDRSEEAMVRANLDLREGDVLDPERLFTSQRNLVLTGAYRQVAVRLLDPQDESEFKDVEVLVRERPRYSGEVGGGFSLAEGPRFVIDMTAPNVGGNGLNLEARGKLNYVGASALVLFPGGRSDLRLEDYTGFNGIGGRANLSAHFPRLYSEAARRLGDINTRADLVFERVHRPSYLFTRYAGIAGLGWNRLESWWRMSANVQYELEHDRVYVPAGVGELLETRRLNERFQEGNFTLHNLRSSVSLDLRKDPTSQNPREGVVVTASGEYTDLIAEATRTTGGAEERLLIDTPEGKRPFQSSTFKAAANLTFYVPLGERVVFATSARAGRIFHLEPYSETIIPKRFFMGGFASMRGFREDGLIPQDDRAALHQDLTQCEALTTTIGCTAQAKSLMAGGEPISTGGDVFLLGKAEVRFPAFGSFDLGVFFETGNLWDQMPRRLEQLGELRYVAGAGLRYPTPIGPLALDFGFNLARDERINEPLFNVHFSIGLF